MRRSRQFTTTLQEEKTSRDQLLHGVPAEKQQGSQSATRCKLAMEAPSGVCSLPGPLHGVLVVASAVGLVQVGNLGREGVVRVRVRQERADRQQH